MNPPPLILLILTSCHWGLLGSPAEETGSWISAERQDCCPLHQSRQSLRHGWGDLPQSARAAPAAGWSHKVGRRVFPLPSTSTQVDIIQNECNTERFKRQFYLRILVQFIIYRLGCSHRGTYLTPQSEFNLCKWSESAVLIRKEETLLSLQPTLW